MFDARPVNLPVRAPGLHLPAHKKKRGTFRLRALNVLKMDQAVAETSADASTILL